ncbi:MAG: hypothetical protein HY042_12820, partial [Spirochaetia bacterium]|nr:hypothetical protein [Spirochaetia bacterium]
MIQKDQYAVNNRSQAELAREINQLYNVLEVNALISSSLDLAMVLDTLMAKAKEVMGAEASSLMLLDEE